MSLTNSYAFFLPFTPNLIVSIKKVLETNTRAAAFRPGARGFFKNWALEFAIEFV